MKETGILFTPDNISAILEGRKTQTRRVVKLLSHFKCPVTHQLYPLPIDLWKATTYGGGSTFRIVRGLRLAVPEAPGLWNDKGATLLGAPYSVGDRLWIKEGTIIHADNRTLAGYYMDGARVTNLGEKRLTAMFMEKQYARTWLEITDVRVQRVQDISKVDALAEGISVLPLQSVDDPTAWYQSTPGNHQARSAEESYAKLWDSINRKTHPWVSNPWVWALTFKLMETKLERERK